MGALNYAAQIVGCGVFLAAGGTNVGLLVAGAVLFGFGIGNTTPMPPLIAQAEFARQDTGRIVALVTAVSQASYAFAPALFGVIREAAPVHDGGAVPWLFIVAGGCS